MEVYGEEIDEDAKPGIKAQNENGAGTSDEEEDDEDEEEEDDDM